MTSLCKLDDAATFPGPERQTEKGLPVSCRSDMICARRSHRRASNCPRTLGMAESCAAPSPAAGVIETFQRQQLDGRALERADSMMDRQVVDRRRLVSRNSGARRGKGRSEHSRGKLTTRRWSACRESLRRLTRPKSRPNYLPTDEAACAAPDDRSYRSRPEGRMTGSGGARHPDTRGSRDHERTWSNPSRKMTDSRPRRQLPPVPHGIRLRCQGAPGHRPSRHSGRPREAEAVGRLGAGAGRRPS
jgi:hypothetical protein